MTASRRENRSDRADEQRPRETACSSRRLVFDLTHGGLGTSDIPGLALGGPS
jgi:hypothetical protein